MRKLIFCFAVWHFFGSALAAEKVVLEMDNDYAPYSFVENGELKGLYVDLLKNIAARLAPTYDVQLQAIPWKRGLYNLEAGKSLAVLPAYRNKDRSYIQVYSTPIYRETVVIFCNEDVMRKTLTQFPDDFSGLTVGVNLGFTLGEKMVAAAKKKVFSIVEAKGNEENLMKLQNKTIDCYANDRLAAQYSAEQLRKNARVPQFKDFKLREAAVISAEDTVIAYSLANTASYKADVIAKMDAALEAAKKSGVIDKMVAALSR